MTVFIFTLTGRKLFGESYTSKLIYCFLICVLFICLAYQSIERNDRKIDNNVKSNREIIIHLTVITFFGVRFFFFSSFSFGLFFCFFYSVVHVSLSHCNVLCHGRQYNVLSEWGNTTIQFYRRVSFVHERFSCNLWRMDWNNVGLFFGWRCHIFYSLLYSISCCWWIHSKFFNINSFWIFFLPELKTCLFYVFLLRFSLHAFFSAAFDCGWNKMKLSFVIYGSIYFHASYLILVLANFLVSFSFLFASRLCIFFCRAIYFFSSFYSNFLSSFKPKIDHALVHCNDFIRFKNGRTNSMR